MADYGNTHKIFLQGIMCRGILSSTEMNNLYDLSLKRCNIEPLPKKDPRRINNLARFIHSINDKLDVLNLKLVKTFDEESPKKLSYLVLANKKDSSDEPSKLTMKSMVTFSQVELSYLKILIKNIMECDAKEITQTCALNRISDLPSSMKKLSQQEAERVLEKFKEHRWLRYADHPDKPNIRLGTRLIVEMTQYLKEVFSDIVYDCRLCNNLVIQSVQCQNCQTNYHLYCVNAEIQKNAEKLMPCKECNETLPKKLHKPETSTNRCLKGKKRSRFTDWDSESDSD